MQQRHRGLIRQVSTFIRTWPHRPVRICLEWLRASSALHADGQISLSKNGRVRVRVADLDSYRLVVDTVWIGLPSGSAGVLGGSLRIDDYRSTP